ncbi:MBL fold metallo-hydrolase RNA specificity domain-containing protein [Rhodoluna limnophila]|uniref:MBL fold metallo-hydrolase RNA specificity domain-containing protein n=1 Tax=Rhodoluna limnophila TaxID=232537 RepID=UPI001105E368|nr:MBL fold metallo-hydrolase [Rhodoluna limnophila]
MSKVSIRFLGAAGTVTGSRFLLSCGQTKVMVDAGLFQGLKELRLKNWTPLPIDPAELSAVILTHAHLDHCGYIPKLVKDGFRGKIHLSKYTGKLAEVVLRDSARIQTEDAKYAAKKGFSKHNPPQALYEEKDAAQAVEQFAVHPFRERIKVAEETYVTFYPAGHILGAAFVVVEFFGKKLLFTGDMGREHHPLLAPPEDIPQQRYDAVITESTYGDREHVQPSTNFEQAITQTIQRGGSVLIPAFAVDRTEVILVEIRELMEAGRIPRVPVYADSPMALKALRFYREAIDEGSAEIRPEIVAEWRGKDPFNPGTLVELETVEQSKTINNPKSPCIIISASGMATGGRVVHHLRDMLPNQLHTVILVGFQAMGTRGRRLADGEQEVKMHGVFVPVKAQIEQMGSFSVHADADELVDWLKTISEEPGQVLVVHGEAGAADVFSNRIRTQLGWKSHAPEDGEAVEL